MGHRPCLLLLKGHPGSGKSTLAKELAAQLAWPLIGEDAASARAPRLECPSPDNNAVPWAGFRRQRRRQGHSARSDSAGWDGGGPQRSQVRGGMGVSRRACDNAQLI